MNDSTDNILKTVSGMTDQDATAELEQRLYEHLQHISELPEDAPALERARIELDIAETLEGLNRKQESWDIARAAFDVFIQHEAWQDAVRERGIENYKTVFCFPVFPGNFGLPRDADNRRIAMVSCNDAGSATGLWGRPLSGLLVVVDYDTREIVELIDTGAVPIPAGGPAVNPEQPNQMPARGPADQRFEISGHWSLLQP